MRSATAPGTARWTVTLMLAGATLLSVGSCGRPLEPSGPVPAMPTDRAGAATDAEPRPVDPTPAPRPAAAPRDPSFDPGPTVRVALAAKQATYELRSTGAWRLLDDHGRVMARAGASEHWTVQRKGDRLRAVRSDGTTTPWRASALTQVAEDGILKAGAKRYRGAIRAVATDSGVLVVNVLPLEDYLRGVVPMEIGVRRADEQAAVEAQAIAARSFTATRLATARAGNGRSKDFDFVSSVSDQVYGGLDAEQPGSNAAIDATAGLVLLSRGRVVVAPFHSTCGGETAAAEEVWRSDGEPHLKRVSDRIPGSDRYYCDIAPRFAWTTVLSGTQLDENVRRYLRTVVDVGRGDPGSVRRVSVESRTPSGRVERLAIRTQHGAYGVRGNDARSVLRGPDGALLNSAYFAVTTEAAESGRIARIVIRGNGYGHGVGMCQWGAIGRARAGQDARRILATYFPGTSIGRMPAAGLAP